MNHPGDLAVVEVTIVGNVKRQRELRDVHADDQLVVAGRRNDLLIEPAVLRRPAFGRGELVNRPSAVWAFETETKVLARYRA